MKSHHVLMTLKMRVVLIVLVKKSTKSIESLNEVQMEINLILLDKLKFPILSYLWTKMA